MCVYITYSTLSPGLCTMCEDAGGVWLLLSFLGLDFVLRSPLSPSYFCYISAWTPGQFIPSCDEDGFYRRQQCDRGECWCVDQNGGEVAGSRIRGKPNCGKSSPVSSKRFTSAVGWPTSARAFCTRPLLCWWTLVHCTITHCRDRCHIHVSGVICILKRRLSLWEKYFEINEDWLDWTCAW